MHTKGASGYDADKFQKLVAMFESPEPPEATNAFRLAVLDLKKKLSAIDQTTLAVKVQVEYEALRRDLQRQLTLANTSDRSGDEYETIVERLYRRISMVEESVSDAPPFQPSQPDPAEDYPGYEDAGYSTDFLTDDYLDEHQNARSKDRPAALDPPHQSTLISGFIDRLKGLPSLMTFYVVICVIWSVSCLLYTYSLFSELGGVFLLLSAAVWVLISTYRKYGRDGVLIKICLFLDALLIALMMALGRDPFTWASHQHALWWTPRPLEAYLVFLLSLAAIVWLPESWMWLILEKDHKSQEWILWPGVMALVLAVVMYFDPSLFGKIPSPLLVPPVVAPAKVPPFATPPPAAHQKHKIHPIAFKLQSSSAVYVGDGPAKSPTVQTGFIFWPFALLGGGLFLNGRRIHAKALKDRTAAQKAAHEFKAPNVHGQAGYASKSDARKKGWI
jgi:hypothetical protein